MHNNLVSVNRNIEYDSSQIWAGPYGPNGANQKWPDGRGLHSAACLIDPESDWADSNQRVIVFWGDGLEAKILNDVWILSVSTLSWTQVCTKMFQLNFCGILLFHKIS